MTSSTPDSAGHRRARTQQRRRHAERKPGQMPERLQHRRTHPARAHQIVELGQVLFFLLGHPADLVAGPAASGDGKLSVVNPHGAIFAGVIDAENALDLGIGRRIAGQVGRAVHVCFPVIRRANSPGGPVRLSDPAHRPRVPEHGGADHSHRERGQQVPSGQRHAVERPLHGIAAHDLRVKIRCRSSSSVVGAAVLGVQALGPANQCCSTPRW